ncbi:MAG: fumarylacetoacetate hydrolase family protein [Rhodospirillaceae bacterium]|nr:fumarylacetoacetate hydrolase family protein [Rhodospirillaceae bacterium]MBT5191056.1 fumarylacetoacetate hydrolase family protein [Rhodospirillaceae bacterium]MBT5895580.1 fumarylacetoacetate hydrolase family protein [Rhodospirillaceae bacterium]MBT6428434.1 fumarylacetoacetate hydrolase family protein [Rhodospirillaceae bacterium]MBT7758634.1 fumarylacetoacetate hydrolase family protein [Rhodospirillaceae bacterium]
MKLCRFDGKFGDDCLGLVMDDQVIDVSRALDSLPAHRWAYPPGDPVIANLNQLAPRIMELAGGGTRHQLQDVALRAPIANPGKIIGAPVNYRAHKQEADDDVALHQGGKVMPIDEIGLFLKATSALAGPADGIRLRFPDRRSDHEGEVVAVIGQTVNQVAVKEAMAAVAGYTLGLDMTVRGKEDRSFRKSCDTYAVTGPWFVTAAEIADPGAIIVETRVNGEVRQQGDTSQLIRSIAELIAMASQFYTLHPGDLIMTGTPAGVGPVAPGDVIEVISPAIGTLRTAVS